ncbi:MAG: hypothetical protein OWU84_07700 [Firmicutes bacterium]|nr:hypothetical protein [Bacillota bacterium]
MHHAGWAWTILGALAAGFLAWAEPHWKRHAHWHFGPFPLATGTVLILVAGLMAAAVWAALCRHWRMAGLAAILVACLGFLQYRTLWTTAGGFFFLAALSWLLSSEDSRAAPP